MPNLQRIRSSTAHALLPDLPAVPGSGEFRAPVGPAAAAAPRSDRTLPSCRDLPAIARPRPAIRPRAATPRDVSAPPPGRDTVIDDLLPDRFQQDDEEWQFDGTGETVVMEMDTADAAHPGPETELPVLRPTPRNGPGGAESRRPRMVRFTPAPMAVVRPPVAGTPLPESGVIAVPAPSRRSLAEAEALLPDAIAPAPASAEPSPPPSVDVDLSSLAPAPPAGGPPPAAPASIGAEAAAPVASAAVARQPGLYAFAGFGTPPKTLGASPTYALRVLVRSRELRRELELACRRRSRDVDLYASALAMVDAAAYRRGLLVIAVMVAAFLLALGGVVVALG